MTLDFFKKVWSVVDNLGNNTKTIIIIFLTCYALSKLTYYSTKSIITDQLEQITNNNKEAEQYTLSVAPQINNCVQAIANKDQDCFDVLLLNYHNSTESLQGFKYMFLNCISEEPKDLNCESYRELWHNLDYLEFADELSKIHNHSYLRLQNSDTTNINFPKLCKKLRLCGAKAAGFYPIEGIESSIGMIVVLYSKPKNYTIDYYNSVIAPSIQQLAVLLDYPYMKKKQSKNDD